MVDEPDTLPDDGGTDNVTPSNDDTPESWDYYDPDEDQDTEEVTEDEGTDDEEGETEEQPDAEEGDEESEVEQEETEEGEPTAADEKAVVKLSDGTETTVGELIKGHFRQTDYSRKTQELANTRKKVEAEATQIATITQTFVDHLSSMIPDPPDTGLAYSNPAQYTAQKAQYDAAMAKVNELIELGKKPKEVTDAMSDEDRRQRLTTENQKLAEMFPETGTQDGRQKFFGDLRGAAETVGFTPQELSGVSDHRLFALAHWAQKGMQAEKARKTVKQKAQKAPPVPQQKPGQSGKNGKSNRDAMSKLKKSGSIYDAMQIDFD